MNISSCFKTVLKDYKLYYKNLKMWEENPSTNLKNKISPFLSGKKFWLT